MAAPYGNTNRSTQHRLKHTIEKVLRRRSKSDELEALERIMEAQVIKAEEGDLQACKEVLDRYAGKSAQALELTGEDGGPIQSKVTVEFIGKAAGSV